MRGLSFLHGVSVVTMMAEGEHGTVLRLFRVIKRYAFRETNEFLFLVPSPKIILGRRFRITCTLSILQGPRPHAVASSI